VFSLLALFPTSCNSFSSNISAAKKSISTPFLVTSKTSLYASNDDSWSPFDDGEDRTSSKKSRSLPPNDRPSSWSPFDDGEDRTSSKKSRSLSPNNRPPPELFTPVSEQTRQPDSLLESLTRTDPAMKNVPTTTIPIFGEIPRDGTLLILVPSIAIAVIGLIVSIKIGIESRDFIATEIEAVTTGMSQPPMTETVVKEGCRGLCSNQAESLEVLRGFMEGLSQNN